MATTTHEKLKELEQAGHAQRDKVRWGRGYRDVIILGGKKYQYNGNTISRILKNRIYSMYIDMPATSSNQNIVINDILSEDVGDSDRLTRRQRIERRKNVKNIERFVKQNKQNLKKKHQRY